MYAVEKCHIYKNKRHSTQINYMKKIRKVRETLEYFRCIIGSTTEACSCWSSRSVTHMLWVWFSSFVPNEHGVKMVAPLQFCTKDKQHVIVRLLVSEGMKGAEIHRHSAAKYHTFTQYNGLQLNHTRSMPLFERELQYYQASAVLPITQRKYSNIALTFWISLVYIRTYRTIYYT
jgi:hypothetical protein